MKKKELHEKISPIIIPKGRPQTVDISPSRTIWFKCQKKCNLPFKQPQISLTTSPTSNIKWSTTISTTIATKTLPMSKISTSATPKLNPKHSISTSVIDKRCFLKKDITPNRYHSHLCHLTKQNNCPHQHQHQPPPRFHMPSSQNSSIMMSLPPSISCTHLPPNVAGTPTIGTLGGTPITPTIASNSHNHFVILKH